MQFLMKRGYYFLIAAILIDIVTPYILGPFYPHYSQVDRLISALGEVGSLTRLPFKMIEIAVGVLFILASPAVYASFKSISVRLAKTLTILLVAFAIGDCLFTGLFDVDHSTDHLTIATAIHGIGSGIGVTALFAMPFFMILVYLKAKERSWAICFIILFILSLGNAVLYALMRLPSIQIFDPSHLGFWQRFSLFFKYLPLLVAALRQIFAKKPI